MSPRTYLYILRPGLTAFIAVWLAWQSPALAQSPGHIIVAANPAFPVDHLTREEIRAIYLGETQFIGGTRVTPIDFHRAMPVRRLFLNLVVGMETSGFDAQWIHRIFSIGGVPPRRVGSIQAAMEELSLHPGGLIFLPADTAIPSKNMRLVWQSERF
ncbi:MAG: hypothetical protein ACE5FN_09320 [Leptospirillia bacterium]